MRTEIDGISDPQDLPTNGPALALALNRRHPGTDWIAALAKAATLPREDVERSLQEDSELPPSLRAAADQVRALLRPPDTDARDDVFASHTNDADAPMEVDSEAGTVVLPANKGMPSQSGSEHEMRTKLPKAEKNEEFLPMRGVPSFVSRLHKDDD